jgi:hypothetical protein
MQILTLEKSQTTRLFWVVVVGLVAVMLYTAKQDDPAVVATALLLAIVAAYPLYFWLLGWSHGLPIWPVFALVNGTFAALPMIQDPATLDAYTPGEIMVGGVTLIGFIALGTAVWLAMTGRQSAPPKKVLMVAREHSDRYLFAFIAAGLFFQLNFLFWWVTFPGNTMSIVRGITVSLNTLGIFVLAFYAGRQMLTRAQEVLLVAMASATALAAAATLIMASAIVPVAMLLLGYALGSSKVPWKGLVAVFVLAAVLHPGKFSMRETYWGEERPPLTLLGMPQYFGDWLSYGFEQVGLTKSDGRDLEKPEASSLFERAGNVHMLLLVQKKSPDEVPFLGGITYEHIPRMLIPRVIDDQKGISHAGNVMLTVNYGVQTIEQTASTSIYWGLVPEAFANFGYLGVAGLAVALGLFYGYVTNLTVGVPMTSLRFVLGLLIMGAATKADTMGVFVTSQFQGIVGVSMAAIFLMRRQGNPFAAEAANGGVKTGRAVGRYGGVSVKSARHGAWSGERGARGAQTTESGMPAAGVLAGLIEGAAEGRADESVRDQESKRRKDQELKRPIDKDGERQLAADGGAVRNLPTRTPKRIARWMPRRVRAAVAAQYAAEGGTGGEAGDGPKANLKPEPEAVRPEMAQRQTGVEEGEGNGDLRPETGGLKEQKNRPRQVSVPFRNYRRYRG